MRNQWVAGHTECMTVTGSVVEHREEVVYVTLFDASGWTTWLVNPSGVRTVVERVEV